MNKRTITVIDQGDGYYQIIYKNGAERMVGIRKSQLNVWTKHCLGLPVSEQESDEALRATE